MKLDGIASRGRSVSHNSAPVIIVFILSDFNNYVGLMHGGVFRIYLGAVCAEAFVRACRLCIYDLEPSHGHW